MVDQSSKWFMVNKFYSPLDSLVPHNYNIHQSHWIYFLAPLRHCLPLPEALFFPSLSSSLPLARNPLLVRVETSSMQL